MDTIGDSIISAIPQNRVLSQTFVGEIFPELSHRPIHGSDLRIALLQDLAQGPFDGKPRLQRRERDEAILISFRQLIVEGKILLQGAVRFVR